MKIGRKKEDLLPFDEANRLLRLDRKTGLLFWKVNRVCVKAGVQAGSIAPTTGYRVITINKRNYLCHRVAWLLHHGEWPSLSIDHVNTNRTDNRIENLRLADFSENGANRKQNRNRVKGSLKGASFVKSRNSWRAAIRVKGKLLNLGNYPTAMEAHLIYCQAAEKFFGKYARAA